MVRLDLPVAYIYHHKVVLIRDGSDKMPAIIDKLPDAVRVECKIFSSYPEHPRVDFHDVELEPHFLQFRG